LAYARQPGRPRPREYFCQPGRFPILQESLTGQELPGGYQGHPASAASDFRKTSPVLVNPTETNFLGKVPVVVFNQLLN